MKRAMQGTLLLMLGIALATLWLQGLEQGALLIAIFGFSGRAYLLAEDYLRDKDRETYDRQMKIVQTFTLACVVISFYWPESMFQNAALLVCLILHCMINRYIKNGNTESAK